MKAFRERIITKSRIRDFALINIGLVLLAVGEYFFKISNGFATGGITGVGTLLGQVTPITTGTWILALNSFLLVIGFVFLGRGAGIKTVYCSLMYSVLMFVLEKIIPLSGPLSDEPFMELFYAMLLTSIGSAMIFHANATSGGTDIIALILKKFFKMNVGKALLAADFVVAVSSFFVFNIKTGLFSMLGLFARAFIVDGVIESMNSCKYFVVITSNPDEISKFVLGELRHGITAHKVVGEYTGEVKVMLHTVCKRSEALRLREKVRKVDPEAFTIITTSSEIIGRGFRSVA